jgi:hypothetical protein
VQTNQFTLQAARVKVALDLHLDDPANALQDAIFYKQINHFCNATHAKAEPAAS